MKYFTINYGHISVIYEIFQNVTLELFKGASAQLRKHLYLLQDLFMGLWPHVSHLPNIITYLAEYEAFIMINYELLSTCQVVS